MNAFTEYKTDSGMGMENKSLTTVNSIYDFNYEIFTNNEELADSTTGGDVKYSENVFIDEDDVLEYEFDESVTKADKTDYLVAMACGVLSGSLSVLWSKKFDLEKAHNWGNEKADDIVVSVAKSAGYKGSSLEGALSFLEKKYPMAGDSLTSAFGGGNQHHLRDFTHHPTVIGLVCSIIMQFSKENKVFGTDTQGNITHFTITKEGLIGDSFAEKIVAGTINWIGHLISDMDGSSKSVLNGTGRGTGIPGPILATLKELSSLPIFSKTDDKNINNPKVFSEYVSKLFNGTLIRNEKGEPIRFDLRTEMGIGHYIADQAKPVVINECLVRTCFMIMRFIDEMHNNDVKTVKDLMKLDPQKFLPFNNRAMTRMVTVSSGTFVAVNVAGVAVKSAMKSHGVKGAFASEFFLSINYVGIGRFVIACASDAKYIKDDIKGIYDAYMAEKRELSSDDTKFKYRFMILGEDENRVLYSLKSLAIEHDIINTKDQKHKFIKKEWLRQWKAATLESYGITDEGYFMDEKHVYADIYRIDSKKDNKGWIYLLVMELALFEPYYTLDDKESDLFKGLKYCNKYISDTFVRKQELLTKDDIDSVRKNYSKYVSRLKDSGKKGMVRTGATVGAAVITGGLALVFAPEIAVVIAGKTVAGLSGAALTSASLAAVGGGSLAAGGLGMAGGTAILTGGGALLGFASGGAASLATVVGETSDKYALNECAKLLSFCKTVIVGKYHTLQLINPIAAGIEKCLDDTKDELRQLDPKDKTNKGKIKNLNSCIKYLSNTLRELDKMIYKENQKPKQIENEESDSIKIRID